CLLRGRCDAVIHIKSNPEISQLNLGGIFQWNWYDRRVDSVLFRQDGHNSDQILYMSRHGTDLPEPVGDAAWWQVVSGFRKSPGSGFDRSYSAKVRRQSNAAARIAAQSQRRAVRRDDCRFTSAASTAGFARIVRIVGPAKNHVVGFKGKTQLRNIGL